MEQKWIKSSEEKIKKFLHFHNSNVLLIWILIFDYGSESHN